MTNFWIEDDRDKRDIQCFIPNWLGTKQHAEGTASIIRPFCPVTILNNPEHYFTEQWEEARRLFTGDILLWVMADVWPPVDAEGMIKKIEFLFSRGGNNIGIYAPDIDWNGHQYDVTKLKPTVYGWRAGMYEVPTAEMLIWALSKDVLDAMPHVDPKVNYLGWGIDYLGAAAAKFINKVAVRDYSFTATHPKSGPGYNPVEATTQMYRWMKTLEPDMLKLVVQGMMLRAKVGVD
jgi:hypothetical protein